MRLSSKILGAGLILAGTALAGCNCCDSCSNRTASNQNPSSNPAMASSQRPGTRTNWNNQAAPSNQGQLAQAGASGQPGSGVQNAAWNTTSASSSGQPMSAGVGSMNPRTNPPAIPVSPVQPSMSTSTPTASMATPGTPVTTPGTYGAQPITPTAYGTGASTTPGAFSASPGSTGAYANPSVTGTSAYNSTPSHVSASSTSSTITAPAADASSPHRLEIPSNTGSTLPSSGSTSNGQICNVSGSSAMGQPTSTPASSYPSSTPSMANPAGTGSSMEMPSVTGAVKGN